MKLAFIWDIPVPTDQGTVIAAVNDMVQSHEALRTKFRLDAAGSPIQQTYEQIEVRPVFAIEWDDPALEAAIPLLHDVPMSPESDWPFRFGLTLVADNCTAVAIVFNHISVDGWSSEILRRHFQQLLSRPSAVERPITEQPLDRANRERAAGTSDRYHRTLARLEQSLARKPSRLFPRTDRDPDDPLPTGYYRALLTSDEVGPAAESIAITIGVSVPVVYLTAASIVLTEVSRNPQIVFAADSANRFQASLRDSVGCYAQHALIPVTVDGNEHLSTLTRRMLKDSLAAYAEARYSYFDFEDISSRVRAQRGVARQNEIFFNYHQGLEVGPGSLDGNDPDAISWNSLPDWPTDTECVCWDIFEAGRTHAVALIGDSRHLSRSRAEKMLRNLVQLIALWASEPALSELEVENLVARLPLPRIPRYGRNWAYVDNSWIDLEAIEQVVGAVEGVSSAAVSLIGDHVVAGVTTSRLEVSPATARSHCRKLLAGNPSTVVPDEFVVSRDSADLTRSAVETSEILHPVRTAERALVAAAKKFHSDFAANLHLTYCEAGGSSRYAPAVVHELAAMGFGGVSAHDFLLTLSLADLSTFLQERPTAQGVL